MEPAVLFVNVGWDDAYDGTTLPEGNHGWLGDERAEEMGSADEALFVDQQGFHEGPVGRGAVPDAEQLDVVFCALNKKTKQRHIVALFARCKVIPHHNEPEFLMVSAAAPDVRCFEVGRRPVLDFWPGKMGWRRWAAGGPGRNWPELFDAYRRLLAPTFHELAVFLPLGAERIDQLHYTTKQRWKSASEAWDRATTTGEPMAIIFGDASRDSGRLFRWARLTEIDASETGTTARWTDVRPLRNRLATRLIKATDGKPLSRDIRRGHVVVRTPSFLLDLPDPAPTTPHTREAGDDPLELEATLRRVRRHQTQFRANLMAAYAGRCAVTGTDVAQVLEAAHIDPHSERGDNRSQNGLLLRADVHALFDEGLLRIEPDTLRIDLAASIRGAYGELHGTPLGERADGKRPDGDALRRRWNRDQARTS